MANVEAPKAIVPSNVPITNPQNLSAVYSNNFAVTATLTDFTITFLEIGQIPGPNGPVQKQEIKAIITLPIPAAKGMIGTLAMMDKNIIKPAEIAVQMVPFGEQKQ